MKFFIFILIAFISGCTSEPSRILPEKEMVIKIKSDGQLGIIAESQDTTYLFIQDTTYLFIDEKAKKQFKIYAEFLAEFQDDISGVSITFLQSSIDDTVYATYVNYIPEEKIKAKKQLFSKYHDRSHTSEGITTVGFNADGHFITQSNTLPEQYRLPNPIEIRIKQVKKGEEHNDFQGIGVGLILPIIIPFMMIGCMTGPC
ncbi:Uncharacterised protein [Providencia rustigianii]|uniref:hypothetical protein n=1 Tax=Providencia rustigianii TaxID=158850 RepID=UPI000F6D62CC|nr:Uncharacterised protein [Providencia rustigianii]